MSNMRQVAKEAGVSVGTVSRILSGDADFKTTEQTRTAVLNAADKLQYVVRNAHKKIQLGCILAVTAEKYSDPFFSAILAAIEEQCDRSGAVISVTRNYEELCNPVVLQELFDADLSGIFLMERLPEDLLHHIREKIPHIVFIDNDEAGYEFDGVGFDHTCANRQVMDYLLQKGYRRIAIISGSSPNEPFSDTIRLTCYREALRRNGISYDELLVKDCNWDLDICAQQVAELISLPQPPDAIFAGSDSLATVVLGTLYSAGIRCPEEIGVIGFNNISLSAHTIPPLTTIAIPTYDIGTVAVQRMMELVSGKSGNMRKILFPTKLVERQSLKT